jgi:hypothetical protein
MRQHTSAAPLSPAPRSVPVHNTSVYVSIRQHTSACVRIRQHTRLSRLRRDLCLFRCRQHTSAYASIRQHSILPAYSASRRDSFSSSTCIRQHTSAYASIRQHTSAYVSIRQHSIRQHTRRSIAYVSRPLSESCSIAYAAYSAYVSIRGVQRSRRTIAYVNENIRERSVHKSTTEAKRHSRQRKSVAAASDVC